MGCLTLVFSSILLGVFAHVGIFIRGEWHLHIFQILTGHVSLFSLALYIAYQKESHPFMTASRMSAAYLTGLYGSMTIYRLFFHKLAGFPGPKLAAVSKLWHVWHIRRSTNHLFLQALHKQYGEVIRTGPNELTLFCPSAFQLLDGWGNTTTRDVWYDLLRPRFSAVFSRSKSVHKEGRKAWVQSMTGKAMSGFNPRVLALVESLSACIRAHDSQPVNVSDVMSWFSFDVMGDVVFGQDFNLLASRTWEPALEHRDGALELLGPINESTWIAHLAFLVVPYYGRVRDWQRMVEFCEERIAERIRRNDDTDREDMAQFFLKEYERLRESMSKEECDLYLAGTVVTAVIAGSDTTRAALISVCWFLAKYPEHAKKIRRETETINIEDTASLSSLPHLNAFINEVLRLAPPAGMTGVARLTGPDGLNFKDVHIPPFTKVTAPRYVIMRLESAYQYPDEFIPERWYSQPELILDRRAFAPFSVGARQCTGKTLAYTELRFVTAFLLRDYDINFAPGYDPMTMWRDMKDQVTAQPGKVLCTFDSRKE